MFLNWNIQSITRFLKMRGSDIESPKCTAKRSGNISGVRFFERDTGLKTNTLKIIGIQNVESPPVLKPLTYCRRNAPPLPEVALQDTVES
jgi:hypothetical protein